MTYSTKKSTLGRALALGLSAAMMSALALVGAAPAVAAPVDLFTVSGVVATADATPLAEVDVSITYTPEKSSSVISSDVTEGDGSFTLTELPVGEYTVELALDGYDYITTD